MVPEKKKCISNTTNYFDFVFQIWPKMNYHAHKEYKKNETYKQKLLFSSKNIENNTDIKK